MKLNEQLNLTIPIDREDGSVVWVHAAPISREMFEQHWLVLSKCFAGIYGEGLSIIAGPRIAALMLKRVAEDAGTWDGPTGVKDTLLAEIRRLANVVAPADPPATGMQMMPLDVAITRGVIDRDDLAEVDGVLTFFSLAWRMHRQHERAMIVTGAARSWSASTSSLGLSAFAASLLTSTETASTGETPAPATSSPPSSTGPVAPDLRLVSPNAPTISPGGPPLSSASAI